MPERETLERAQEDAREGKSPSTQAGEFVKEEIDHIREGKHGARSPQQAIAIGLSKARRAGVKLPPPKKGSTSEATRTKAARDERRGQSSSQKKTSAKRSRGVSGALKREGKDAASHSALSKQAHRTARPAWQCSAETVSSKGRAHQGRRQAAARRRRKPASTRTRRAA